MALRTKHENCSLQVFVQESGNHEGTLTMPADQLLRLCRLPWPGSSVGWSIIPICQSCGFDPQSGHIQETTSEGMNKWDNNRHFFLSPFPPRSKIKKKKIRLQNNAVCEVSQEGRAALSCGCYAAQRGRHAPCLSICASAH